MCAITLMYFTDVTLNIISLSGLALGVGMLVDNSIVVIENIYRLRSLGVPASKAAIQGRSRCPALAFCLPTLTTICVFLPIVFTQGISRELFTDMGLTIAYSLLASLVVALTLVPAMGAAVLKKTPKRKATGGSTPLWRGYQRLLGWALRHKAPVLSGVTALAISIFLTTQMGTAFIPAMDSPQMSATLTMPGRGAAGCLCHGGYRHGAHRGRGWCGDRRRDVRRQRYVLDDGRLVLRRQHHLLYPAV